MLGRTKRIHFVGIGGIGMSGIAELLKIQGFDISGSDMNATDLTRHLQSLGITVHAGHDAAVVHDADVVVKSSAVTDDNPEVAAALAQKIPVIRRAEMLSEIMRMSYGIGIAGTHGKTTTTSMVGMVLQAAALEPTIIVGGKVMNLSSNNLLGSGEHIVVEADEFDRSFLTLTPIIAGITNIEADHLDCYPDLAGIQDAFVEFANKVPFFGCIIACLDDHGVQAVIPRFTKRLLTYGFSRQADVRAVNVHLDGFAGSYDLIFNGYTLGRIDLRVMGRFNILNSLLAASVGLELDIPFEAIRDGLGEFKGVFRRFEHKGERDGVTVYDDYAHHPTEIEATLSGVREASNRRIVAVFQPHLFSRTRDFADEFGRSFYHADVLLVTPIYPAREQPLPGITGRLIAEAAIQSGHRDVHYIERNDDIVPTIEQLALEGDIVITMGAGPIFHYGERYLAGGDN
ncbi:MAG: UDP-N-acetylmuramate--L-alanine ligase [Candidatus Cloacimonetes bacterium]|nr:UDP-N-acetylmuramate--L-alanine ligase [Candidatus Cloacimonadota bacterium]